MLSVPLESVSTVATRNQLVAENSTLTPTYVPRHESPLRTCFGKKEGHLLGATRSMSTTTRSTRSDAARTPPSSKSSLTKVATLANTTVNCPWATPSCWSPNSRWPHLKSEQPDARNSRKNCVQPEWMFLKRKQPSPRSKKPDRPRLKLRKPNAWRRLKPLVSKRYWKQRKPLSEPCLNFKLG